MRYLAYAKFCWQIGHCKFYIPSVESGRRWPWGLQVPCESCAWKGAKGAFGVSSEKLGAKGAYLRVSKHILDINDIFSV